MQNLLSLHELVKARLHCRPMHERSVPSATLILRLIVSNHAITRLLVSSIPWILEWDSCNYSSSIAWRGLLICAHVHFSCFWHEKDNVGHRTLLVNFDHEQVPCVSGSQQTNASWSFFNNSFWDSVKSKCFPVGSAAIFLRFLHAFVFCITSLAMFFFLSGCVCILFNSSQNLVVGIPIFLISEFSHIFNIPRVGIKNSNISKFLRDSQSFMMHVSIFWFRDPKALACIINLSNF